RSSRPARGTSTRRGAPSGSPPCCLRTTSVTAPRSSAMADSPKAVGVVGGGLMGSGIAETVARAGYQVKVYEPIVESRDASRGRIEKSIARAESSGRISAAERQAAMGRLRYVADLDELSDSDLGMHFFSPVPVMGLVEVVSALPTGEDTIERATEFVKSLGKTPISTKDRSGFI